jgi:hypothetical protein
MQQMRVGFGTHGFFAEKILPKRLAEVASWLLRSSNSSHSSNHKSSRHIFASLPGVLCYSDGIAFDYFFCDVG